MFKHLCLKKEEEKIIKGMSIMNTVSLFSTILSFKRQRAIIFRTRFFVSGFFRNTGLTIRPEASRN